MSTYLLIDLIIIFFPLILSLIPYFKFYDKLPRLFLSILMVGGFFAVWDILVVYRGDWAFDPAHILGLKFIGLPLEEYLFFIVVPYACIFLYEGFVTFFKDRKLPYDQATYMALGTLFMVFSIIFFDRQYTSIVFFVFGFTLLMGGTVFREMFSSLFFLLYLLFGLAFFLIFNYFLTSIPIVHYNPSAILNIRVLTIPVEDFFYNFAMLSLYLGTYLKLRSKR